MKPSESGRSEHELTAELAERIYEQEGRPRDQAEDHWFRAERALRQLRLSEAPSATRRAQDSAADKQPENRQRT